MSGRRIALLGHTGFIGRRVAAALERDIPDVEVVGADLPRLDLTDAAQAEGLAEVFEPDVAVVMCSGIKRQLGDTLDTFSQNVAMAVNVCRVLERRPVRRFVYFSSSAVYGEDVTNTAIDEDTPPTPTSRYGLAKFTSERLLATTLSAHGAELLLLRPPLVFGPGDLALYGPSGFARSALADGVVTLWGEGDELREFVLVDDVARLVAGLALDGPTGPLNVVRGRSSTFRDVAELVAAAVPGTRIESRPRSKPKADHAFTGAGVRQALAGFEFTPLADSVALTLDAARATSVA